MTGTPFSGVTLTRFAAAVASGGLMALAFPKIGWTPLGLVGLLPLLWALRRQSFRQAFGLGLVYGLINSFCLLYFLTHVMTQYGGLSGWLSGGIFLLLAVVLALYAALWSGMWALWPDGGLARVLASAALWAGLEWTRTWMLTGFPWEDIGYLLTPWTTMVQLADLGGVGLASFLVLLANLSLAEAVLSPGRWRPLVVCLLIWAAALGYGVWRLDDVADRIARADRVTVRVVQSNIDQNVKWSRQFAVETVDVYLDLSVAPADPPPELIVFSETSMPFYVTDLPDQIDRLRDLAVRSRAWLLFGAPAHTVRKGGVEYYNRAYLISPRGRWAGYFDKAHLVPYGEYVPLKRFMPFLRTVVEQVGSYSPGRPGKLLETSFGGLGVLICYETIFPELSRAHARSGAALLINMTNDSWFGDSSAPWQHLSMLTWRAVEVRRSVARSAQNGISALIGPDGRIRDSLGLYRRGALTGSLPILDEKTIYLGGGWLFGPLCLVLALAAWTGMLIRRPGLRKEKKIWRKS